MIVRLSCADSNFQDGLSAFFMPWVDSLQSVFMPTKAMNTGVGPIRVYLFTTLAERIRNFKTVHAWCGIVYRHEADCLRAAILVDPVAHVVHIH